MHFLRIIIGLVRWIFHLLNFARKIIISVFFIFLILVGYNFWIHVNKNQNQIQNLKHGALLLDIAGVVVDTPSKNNQLDKIFYQRFGANSFHFQENSLFEIVDAIRTAKEDKNITGIILDLKDFIGADQPSMEYIGKALHEFSRTGKPVIAIGSHYSQEQYYLASFANKIWLSSQGEVDLHGFSTNSFYYKTLLKKLKVNTHIFRIGTYKSAVEPFICDRMSIAARRSNQHWINELWNNYLLTIATNRKIRTQQVFPGAKKMLNCLHKVGGDTAKYALENKLVDSLFSNWELKQALSKEFNWNEKDKNYQTISIYDYKKHKLYETGDAIAVIFVNGIIMDGKGKETSGNIGSDIIAAQIHDACFDPKVKAIVLRVNSPGGGVHASEIIRAELSTAHQMSKPVVVSMGGIAASGGYWISTPANYIIASKSTLTGSIGVFGIMNTLEKSLDSLGIHADGVATSPLADVTPTKALPSEVLQMMQLNIENSYKRFIALVSQSRNKTQAQISKISQGRVWTGLDAKKNGLIDSIGDFDDAVNKAAELAKLKQWYLYSFRDETTFLEMFVDRIFKSINIILGEIIKNYLSASVAIAMQTAKTEGNYLLFFNDPKNCYSFCLACTNVR